MPHGGHFIAAHRCAFRLNTFVNGFIVSTVGEYEDNTYIFELLDSDEGRRRRIKGFERRKLINPEKPQLAKYEELAPGAFYETYVFKGRKTRDEDWLCCPFEVADINRLDADHYNCPVRAYQGHLLFCEKYDKIDGGCFWGKK